MADEDDELLQKADDLMRRRRAFVADTGKEPKKQEVVPPSDGDDDIPLLTEVVGADALAASPPGAQDNVAALRQALTAELEAWLDNELPAHVQHVLDGITDQLILQLAGKARTELLPRLHELLAASRKGAESGPDAE